MSHASLSDGNAGLETLVGRGLELFVLHQDMIRGFLAICACLWCAVASAQPSDQPAPGAPNDAGEPADANPATGAGSRLFVRDPDGRWVAAADAGAASVSETGEESLAPPAYIAQLQIDGRVEGNLADLTATIRVEITRTDDWYELPLAFDQARIYESIYDGEDAASGQELPAPVVPHDGETGVRWQFKGIGTHRLTLKFRLPIKTTTAGQQLQLSLPALPTNYVTHAALRIPGTQVVVSDPPANVTQVSRVLETGETELHSDIVGSRWDLSWRNAAPDEPSLGQIRTGIVVRRDAGPLTMLAKQECEVEQGSVSEVTARLPTNFKVDTVSLARNRMRELPVEPVADRPGWVRVRLEEELQGSFELEWRLTAPFPPGGGPILIDGLEIADARRQGGTIEIESIDGYTARYLEDDSDGLQRGDVGEFSAAGTIKEFRFLFQRQPWHLQYALRPVEAGTDCATESFLLIDSGRHDLYLDVQLQVFTGQVQEIVIDWPGHTDSGWSPQFDRVILDAPGLVEPVTATLDVDALSADQSKLRLQLSRACSGTLRTLLHFTRTAQASGALDLTLPRPVATRSAAPALTVASDVIYTTTVTSEGIAVDPVLADRPLPASLPPKFAGRSVHTFAFAPNPAPVTVQWSEQKRTITSGTTLTVEADRSPVVKITQDITYDVSFGYVTSLLIEAPASSNETPSVSRPGRDSPVQFYLDGLELSAELRDNLWRVQVPERIGRFTLTIKHLLPTPTDPEEADRLFVVPILKTVDVPFETTVIRLNSLRLAPQENGWRTWLTASHENAWSTTAPRSYVQLQVDDEARLVSQQFIVDTAFIRTWFDKPGQADIYGEFAIREAGESIAVTLPSSAVNAEFRWQGELLTEPDAIRANNEIPGRFVLQLPLTDGQSTTGHLTVRYGAPQPSNPSLVSTNVAEFPQFDVNVVVKETYWEVVLPPGMQLSTPPASMIPQYTWERDTFLWKRQPTTDYLTARAEFAHDESIAAPSLPRGNSYAYAAVGAVSQGAVGAMAVSLIVLIGAGFSLLLGFVFRRIPATRNMLSVLALGFLGTLAGLWRLELVQLLLQPAVLGLLLAVVAARFDIARDDRRRVHRDTTIERPPSNSGRRPAAIPRVPALPPHTAVYHPDSASGSARGL